MRNVMRLAGGAVALLIAASALAADPAKVLRISFPVAETGFDPVRVSDLYSNTVNEAIFERLLTYDYLARPAKLVPLVAACPGYPVMLDGGVRRGTDVLKALALGAAFVWIGRPFHYAA